MRVLCCLLLALYIPQLFATPTKFTSLIECEKSPRACITFTDEALKAVEPFSLEWYHLKHFSLSAHWQIADTDPLREELESLATLKDAPAVFRVTVLTIYSKLLLSEGQDALGNMLVSEVIPLIQEVNEVSLNPDRYAELIVLLNSVRDFDQAERVGSELLKMFTTSRRTIELGDFYTALGHTKFRLAKYQDAQDHYQAALTSFTEMRHPLEISNTHHNIARSYQAMNRHVDAIPHFQKALEWKASVGEDADPRNEQYTRMRLVESLMQTGQRQQAYQAFTAIKPEYVLKSYQPLYNQIASSVGATAGIPQRR